MTKLQYLKQVLDKPIYGITEKVPVSSARHVTARLGKDEQPLHCPYRTTDRNKPTRLRGRR